MPTKTWSLGRGGIHYLLPDERELYTIVRQRIPVGIGSDTKRLSMLDVSYFRDSCT